jgi:hypothetical protein
MEFPKGCPVCKATFLAPELDTTENVRGYLIQRAAPDWDSDKPDRIEDAISECSNCHSLFRLRWKLESFTLLVEAKEKSVVTEKKGGRDCGQTSATGQAIPDVECVNSTSATTPDSNGCVEKEKGEQK